MKIRRMIWRMRWMHPQDTHHPRNHATGTQIVGGPLAVNAPKTLSVSSDSSNSWLRWNEGVGLRWVSACAKGGVPRPVRPYLSGTTGSRPSIVQSHSCTDCWQSPNPTQALVRGGYCRACV